MLNAATSLTFYLLPFRQMKTLLSSLLLIAACIFLLTISSCRRKDDDDVTPTTDSATLQETNTSSDESTVSAETDDATSAVDDYLNSNTTTLLRQGASTTQTAGFWNCGGNVAVDASLAAQRQYTLTYTNSVCNGRTRNGKIIFKLTRDTNWTNPGAILRITYDNFTVSRQVNGATRTIVINGYHDITNVNGGRIIQATATRTILHKVRGNMLVGLNGGGYRSWIVARKRSYTSGNNGLTVKIEGDTAIGTKTKIDVIGANRYDNQFISMIEVPIVSNAQCGFWKPVQGKKIHEINLRNIIVTFGLDASGNAVTGTNCATHYRIKAGTTNSLAYDVLLAY